MTLKCDGELVNLPNNIQNIVFLNISSWAGGATNLWQQNASDNLGMKSRFKKQSICDKTIEVIGLTSIVHLGSV